MSEEKPRCQQRVPTRAWLRDAQCRRAALVGTKFCKQHTPEIIEKKRAEKYARWGREFLERRKVWALQAAASDLLAACKALTSQLRTLTHSHPDDEINNVVLELADAAIKKAETYE